MFGNIIIWSFFTIWAEVTKVSLVHILFYISSILYIEVVFGTDWIIYCNLQPSRETDKQSLPVQLTCWPLGEKRPVGCWVDGYRDGASLTLRITAILRLSLLACVTLTVLCNYQIWLLPKLQRSKWKDASARAEEQYSTWHTGGLLLNYSMVICNWR